MNEELIKIIKFIETSYKIKLKDNEIKSISDELKDYTFERFENELKDKLLKEVKYFNLQNLYKILKSKENYEINWNSCYWYEIEREWCEKHNKPYYDITKGPDYPLSPYRR